MQCKWLTKSWEDSNSQVRGGRHSNRLQIDKRTTKLSMSLLFGPCFRLYRSFFYIYESIIIVKHGIENIEPGDLKRYLQR